MLRLAISLAAFLGALAPSGGWAQHEGHGGAPVNKPRKQSQPQSAPHTQERDRESPGSMPAEHPMPATEAQPPAQHPTPQGQMPPMQHQGMRDEDMGGMVMSNDPIGLPMSREGSGTSWLPDSSPMYALHRMVGEWTLMFHENVFVGVDSQGGARGDTQGNSINWVMGMAQGPILGGQSTLRAMASLEPFTVGNQGYPLLLQTGEGLVDRQHPHDLFMELSVDHKHALGENLSFLVYGGLVGEPALGPTAFPHRVSSFPNPLAPLSHHIFDSTHITFGVLTAGLYTRSVMLEGSLFNGREPDAQNRTNIDLAPLDAFSARLTVAPTRNLTAQVSAGRLNDAEGPGTGLLTRLTASATYNVPLAGEGNWASTLAAGVNFEEDETAPALLAETVVDVRGPSAFFGRAELVGKPAEDLELAGDEVFPVGALSLGYLYERDISSSFVWGIGVQGSVSVVPDDLAPVYGGQALPGGMVFVRLRPAETRMAHAPGGVAMR